MKKLLVTILITSLMNAAQKDESKQQEHPKNISAAKQRDNSKRQRLKETQLDEYLGIYSLEIYLKGNTTTVPHVNAQQKKESPSSSTS